MLVHISDGVLQEILKLQAVEEGRLGNYTKVDEQLDKFRYAVSDLAMGAIMAEIHKLQNNRLPYLKPGKL